MYYLSEVVVLELTSAGLYLECRLLDMRTGAPDFAACEPAEMYIKTVLPRTLGAVSPRTMSPRRRGASGKSSVGARLPNRADVYVRRDIVLYEM